MSGVGQPMLGDEPTVLLVARGERLAPALHKRLSEHGMYVEVATPNNVAGAAFAAAPDLIVLAGEAAADGGLQVLEELKANPMTSTLPVLLISSGGESDLGSDFRHGVVAVLDRSASADEMARRIADVAHEIPNRTGETHGEVSAENIEDVLALVGDSLRSGILALRNEQNGRTSQIVVHGDKPVETVVNEILSKLRPLVSSSGEGTLSYEFHETPAGRFSSVALEAELDDSIQHLKGRSVLVVEQNAARADLLTQDLRAAGARVVVVDASGQGIDIARENHPDVVLIDGSGMEGWALAVFRAIRRDVALRWASVLVVEADRLWQDKRRPDLGLLASSIEGLMRPDRDLEERARSRDAVDTRLETIGPVRTLRALLQTGRSLRVHVRHARAMVEIDLTDGLVACAKARTREETTEGPAALATLLGLASAKVRITTVEAPRSADVMAPLDAALVVASKERAIVAPSLPPAANRRSQQDIPTVPKAANAKRLADRIDGLASHFDVESDFGDGKIAGTDESVTGAMTHEAMQRLKARMRRATSDHPPVAVPVPKPSSPSKKPIPKPLPRPKVELEALSRSAANKVAARKSGPGAFPKPLVGLPTNRPARRRAATMQMGSPVSQAPSESAPSLPPVLAPDQAGPRGDLATDPPTVAQVPSVEVPSVEVPSVVVASGEVPSVVVTQADIDPTEAVTAPPPRKSLEPDWSEAVTDPPSSESLMSTDAAPDIPEIAAVAEPLYPRPEPEGEGFAWPDASAADALHPKTRAEVEAAARTRPPSDLFDIGGGATGEETIVIPKRKVPWALVAIVALGVVVGFAAMGAWVLMTSDDSTPIADATGGEGTIEVPEGATVELGRPDPTGTERGEETAPDTPSGDTPGAEPPADSAPGEDTVEEPPPEPTRPGSSGLLGPGPDDPIEGRAEDFDPADFGIIASRGPDSRRARQTFLERRLHEGNMARRRGDMEEAAFKYCEVLGVEPGHPRATAGLARVAVETEELEDAILLAQRLVRLRNNIASNYIFLGDTLQRAGNVPAARRAFERAGELEPQWDVPPERLNALNRQNP